MSNNNYKFSGKYIIKADLRCITGLHIGGTDEGFEIGGMDNPVIKDPITGYPYIPGSSLKGKMRSLLEWADGMVKPKEVKDKEGKSTGKWKSNVCNCGSCDVCIIFGVSADTKGQKEPTRLIVRDSFPKGLYKSDGKILAEDNRTDTIAEWKNLGVNIYTEVKTENAIDRLTSEANPRSMERVPADSVFEVEILFEIYKNDDVQKLKKLFEAMHLLEDSTLGGSGSRGSGKVVFENFKVENRDLEYYHGTKPQGESIALNGYNTAKAIKENFGKIFNLAEESKNANTSNQINP